MLRNGFMIADPAVWPVPPQPARGPSGRYSPAGVAAGATAVPDGVPRPPAHLYVSVPRGAVPVPTPPRSIGPDDGLAHIEMPTEDHLRHAASAAGLICRLAVPERGLVRGRSAPRGDGSATWLVGLVGLVGVPIPTPRELSPLSPPLLCDISRGVGFRNPPYPPNPPWPDQAEPAGTAGWASRRHIIVPALRPARTMRCPPTTRP